MIQKAKLATLASNHREAVSEISRGLSESASDTPGMRSPSELHPERVPAISGTASRCIISPFANRGYRGRLLNPRLISVNPSGSFHRAVRSRSFDCALQITEGI